MPQTLGEFGQTIKAKYPQYNDIPDAELGHKMLAKYPQYKDMIDQNTPVNRPDSSTGTPQTGGIVGGGVGQFTNDVGGIFMNRTANIKSNIQNNAQRAIGETNFGAFARDIGESGLQTAGEVAGTGIDLAGAAINAATPQFAKDIFGNISNNVMNYKNTKTGKSLNDYAQSATDKWNAFSQPHPNASKDIGAAGNIASILLANKASPTVKDTVSKIKNIPQTIADTAESAKNKISGIFSSPDNAAKTALEAVTPSPSQLTPTEYESALKANKIIPKTATQPAKYVLSDNEKSIAVKYQNLLTSKDPVKNSINVMNEIANKDKLVEDYLGTKGNIKIWSKPRLANTLAKELEPITDITIPDASRLESAKRDIVDSFVKSVKGSDLKALWKARKEFDGVIERKLKAFSGAPTLKKEISVGLRNAVQDFISTATKEDVYSGYMKDMRQLFNLQDTIATKAVKERGASGITAWVKANPIKAKAAGLIVGGGIAVEAGKGITGL